MFLRNRKKKLVFILLWESILNTIGKIYFVEMMLIGISSMVIGISVGVLFS